MANEMKKKIEEQIRGNKCIKKGCLSEQKDNLEIVWFGKNYENKEITCTSCFIRNDEALKKSIPSFLNILPLSAFAQSFVDELKKYEEIKQSNNWLPKIFKDKQKELATQIDSFEVKLSDTLKSLIEGLANFIKKVGAANHTIFQNKIFDELIVMNTNEKLDKLLEKVIELLKVLNVPEENDHYRFDDIELRQKRIEKLTEKINEITKKTFNVLERLLDSIKQSNATVQKI